MTSANGVLIIGGSGFVASSLIPKMKQPTYVISRQEVEDKVRDVEYFTCELDDENVLRRILPKCSWLIHLACDSTPGISAQNPNYELSRNLSPSIRLLATLQDFPEVNIVYLSSGGTVYGTSPKAKEKHAISESAELLPQSYYGAGKIALEAFIAALTSQSPRTSYILRPSNLYGPGQKIKPGFGIIPTIIDIFKNNKTLQIWGSGEAVRDYLYIEDFTDLLLKTINRTTQQGTFIFNVGSGQGSSLNEVIKLSESIVKRLIDKQKCDSRAVDVDYIVLDSSKVRDFFKWTPKTPLARGLKVTLAFHKLVN